MTASAPGIPVDLLDKAASESIRHETAKVSALSAARRDTRHPRSPRRSAPDTAQYLGHMLRIAQKLAHLDSWPELFPDDGGDVDEATRWILTLFFGVTFGTQLANAAVGNVAGMPAEQVAKELPKKALTMTTQSFTKGVSKAIPVVGAVVSGGFTLATYLPMSKRLKKHLAGLPAPGGPVAPCVGGRRHGRRSRGRTLDLRPSGPEPHGAATTAVKPGEPTRSPLPPITR